MADGRNGTGACLHAWAGGMAIVLAAALLAAPALAQGAGTMPVIKAPDEPARMAPALSHSLVGRSGQRANSFVQADQSLPELDEILPAKMPVVVELYTSQGCSSCPPADKMMVGLISDPDVLALSFHVDYWDYLGWADSFARPEFSARQEAYAQAAGERALYTPQLIVNGQDTAVAPDPVQVTSLIDTHRMSAAMVSVQCIQTPEGDKLDVTPLSDLGGPLDLWLLRYVPERKVRILAGENRGREITYNNIVLSVERIAGWDGMAPLRMTVQEDGLNDDRFPEDTRHIVLIQRRLGAQNLPGPIYAVVDLD